jgi:ABC-type lipoprotein export system ATPase subunit
MDQLNTVSNVPRPIDIDVRVIREPAYTPMTPRKRRICWDFGIPPREEPFIIADHLSVRLSPGAIILLLGPSGTGKSSVLRAIAERIEHPVWVGRARMPTARAVVDAVAPAAGLPRALEILTACGLGEPRLWIRQYGDLSDGERFRAGLARAIGASLEGQGSRPIFCDEFTAILHRRMAKAVAYNLRKLVTRHGLTLVVASTHEDIIEDLQPDQTVRLGSGPPQAACAGPRDNAMSLRRRAAIEQGSVRDYRFFGPMHYRHRDGLGFVDKVFLLKESPKGSPLGILVFAHAPTELALRNRSTDGRFVRNLRRLNRELRILRRLVMHPDVRGCGLGHWFVANTLPKVGVRFIECLAAMGAVNPVFEKAGMCCIGRCPLPRGRLQLLQRMQQLKVDPFSDDFPRMISRHPRVRRMVQETIDSWTAAMQGGARYCTADKSPLLLAHTFRQLIGEPPLYYLWDREGVYPRADRPDQRADDQARANPAAPPHERPLACGPTARGPAADRAPRRSHAARDRHSSGKAHRHEPGHPRRPSPNDASASP